MEENSAEKYLKENEKWLNKSKLDEFPNTEYLENITKIKLDEIEEIEISYKHYKLTNPKAVIFLIHGLANCSEILAPIANNLLKQEYEVYAYDLIGHGKSFKGPTCTINDYKTEIIEASWKFIEVNYEANKDRYKKIPLFLWGESLGGGTAITLAMKPQKQIKINGIIVSGPMIIIEDKPNACSFCLIATVAKCCNFGVGEEDQTKNTSIESQQILYKTHPECFSKSLPVSTVVELFDMSDYIVDTLKKTGIDIPCLIQYGKEDRICNHKGFELLFDCNKNKNKRMLQYNGRHCISHDQCIFYVLEDLNSWLNETINY